MKTYIVSYRNEFIATVRARSVNDAMKKFETNKVKIECCSGSCWPEYFKVTDAKTEKTLKEMGE